MIKQLSNSVIAKYCDLSMSRRSIICLSLRLRQIIDLLATDKSQYFAQPRPIIVNYTMSSLSLFQKCYFTAWFGTDLFLVVERSKDITHVKLLPSLVAKISDIHECKYS